MKNICLNGTFKIDLISHTQLPLRCWALNRFLSYAQTFHHLGRFVVAGSPQNTSISRQKTNKKKIPLGKNCCCRITMKDSNFETILKLGSFLVHNDLMMRDLAQVKHFCDSIHMWHEYIVFWCLPITIPGKAPHQREEIERTAQHFQGPEKTKRQGTVCLRSTRIWDFLWKLGVLTFRDVLQNWNYMFDKKAMFSHMYFWSQ